LGSASIDQLKQSGERLVVRFHYYELSFVVFFEFSEKMDFLWLRGGFPDSLLAKTDNQSMIWRKSFIGTYLETVVPQLGARISFETLRRFWAMLAYFQGVT
jgi:uncharacterized protein